MKPRTTGTSTTSMQRATSLSQMLEQEYRAGFWRGYITGSISAAFWFLVVGVITIAWHRW